MSIRVTTSLGGTASDVTVGKVAPVPDEQCFEAIKAGVDALPPGTKMFLNGGEFYGHNLATTNLEMIARFFEKYPDYVDKTFLSIKVRPANLRRSVELINEKLRGTKRLDLFECARVDPNVPLEESIRALVELKNEGKLDHIGMSECSADSLRRGNAVHPITAVEIEVSPWEYGEEAKKVIATAEELGIAVIAYSPLGRGFLTGQIKRPEDIPEGDYRRSLPRFQEDNFKLNFAIVDALTAIARSKNVTSAQLSIAWVASLGKHVIPLPGSSHAKRTRENCAGGDIELSTEDIAEINSLISAAEIRGDRWTPEPVPDEQCFEAIKAGVDALPPGTKMFLNGGEFYGHNLATTNLEMIARFFEKYPDYVDKTFLSIKGGLKPGTVPLPDGSPANLRRSVELINEKLRGTKRLDLFQSARVDPSVPLEESIKALVELKNEGKLDHIGMSECSADSLRRGNAVHPITAVEIEVSPWEYGEEAKKVIATAEELGIAVVTYSYNFKHNFAIVDALTAIARSKNVTSAQLSIAWVASLGKHVIPLPGSSHAKRTRENCAGGDIELSTEDIAEINSVISAAEIKGGLYHPYTFRQGSVW
ncbi:Aldo/keto reductase [Suillus subalutaceus]|uniref:Aldo/keto reductase n=1 Tax=Suillus subalutaceus TaxID=48586 RepID=UPI001B866FBA|nr:Aldo/keto reductase [Suillus subalutaceus]KAG1877853.1 Aldo/keto reductase [Suillus subalutaceus]